MENPENSIIFAGGLLVTINFSTGISFSEMNNDADFLFIAVRQQMIGFSDMANSFDLEG